MSVGDGRVRVRAQVCCFVGGDHERRLGRLRNENLKEKKGKSFLQGVFSFSGIKKNRFPKTSCCIDLSKINSFFFRK
jgi:hypothetical protein